MLKNKFQQLAHYVPNVSHETFADLCSYESLLRKWQPHINLVANSTLESLWERHILDSAQLYPGQEKAKIWLDFGSGGGFPALVIACFLKQRNRAAKQPAQIGLIESNGKKAAFLRQVIQQLSLPAQVYQNRIENIAAELPLPNVITARALAPLTHLFGYFAPLFAAAPQKHEMIALIQKGRNFLDELEEAKRHWHFTAEIKPSAVHSDSVIAVIRALAPLRPVLP